MLCLVAGMAAAVMAMAGTASATVLCSTTQTACPAGQIWPNGTFMDWSLKAGASAAFNTPEGKPFLTCTTATFKAKIQKAGGAVETVMTAVPKENVIWGNCTFTKTTLEGGEFEIHHTAGTDNGTVTAKNFTTTFNFTGGSCLYTYGAATNFGTLKGGAAPIIEVNAALNKIGGFLCPQLTLKAEFMLTESKGTELYPEPA
jgi:hypothetical protein